MGLRVLIVDDERPARTWMHGLLKGYPQIATIEEAAGVAEAIEKSKAGVDVVFLDIRMPPGNGFDLLPHLPAGTHIVFVTAYDRFAVKAFEANALDYLLKPVRPERLAETLSRLPTSAAPALSPIPLKTLGAKRLGVDDFISIPEGDVLRVVPVGQIAAVEADASYTRVYIAEEETMHVFQSIGNWERSLQAAPFARLDRSLLVNLVLVREIQVLNRNRARVLLEGAGFLDIGRSALFRLRKLLQRAHPQVRTA